ncbi:protealysin inhibitor emfourin [Amycolatopsis sp. lyj-23]|uniref:protealysin inhibitor emfourin n=1 Tax=Amycolatopsis sp. lyj-23 TaxID=2789283 RepID=UPI00397A9A32
MKVRVTRSGGFTGVPRTTEVDVADLPAARAAEVREALAAIDFTAQAAPSPVPDGFRYRIEVWRDGGHEELAAADPSVPAPVRRLLSLLKRDD